MQISYQRLTYSYLKYLKSLNAKLTKLMLRQSFIFDTKLNLSHLNKHEQHLLAN